MKPLEITHPVSETISQLPAGIIGVVGPNSAGKSHFLHTLSKAKSTAIGFAASDIHFFGSHPDAHFHAIRQGWRELDVEKAAKTLGYDSRTLFRKLSVGQRQMVINAAALASNKETLLLDEPFNGLDITHRQQLRQEILDLLTDAVENETTAKTTQNTTRRIIITSQHSEDLGSLIEFVIPVGEHTVYEPYSMDNLRSQFPVVEGLTTSVQEITDAYPVLQADSLGPRTTATLSSALSPSAMELAKQLGIKVSFLNPSQLLDAISIHANNISRTES